VPAVGDALQLVLAGAVEYLPGPRRQAVGVPGGTGPGLRTLEPSLAMTGTATGQPGRLARAGADPISRNPFFGASSWPPSPAA
jgi:hypothetical protein